MVGFPRSISVLLTFLLFLGPFLVLGPGKVNAIRYQDTTWFLRSTTAASAFGTTGPTSEQSSMTDLVSGSPASKGTALAMMDTPGTSQTSVAGTETSLLMGNIWMNTFLSPKLAAQTITAGTTFRFEGALQENSLAANMTFKIHVYLWREGTGYVSSFFDGTLTLCGSEPTIVSTERSQGCVTTATLSDVTINSGDQIALEVWINSNNISNTSFTGTHYFEGTDFVGNGNGQRTVSSAMSSLSVNRSLEMLNTADDTTTWYLSNTSSASAFGTTGPSSEYSTATDNIPSTPGSKGTAKSMGDLIGNTASSLTFTESSLSTQKVWMGTFLSPLLASQTIPASTVIRFESAVAENGSPANMMTRLHIYLWREGTGYVSSLWDTVDTTDCGPEAGITTRSVVCLSSALGSSLSVQDGDQIAIEVWIFANNTSSTGYSATFYYEGNEIIENGINDHNVSNSARTALSFSNKIELLDTLSMDIVDANGDSVASPNVTFSSLIYSTSSQNATGTLGDSSAKMRVINWGSSKSWTMALAASDGSTAKWSNGSRYYDYNDAGTGIDGADADSFGGRLTVNASIGTLSAAYGCSSTTGVSKGSSNSFAEGSVSSISLLVASGSASYNCAWDLTGVGLTQVVPGWQPGGTYSLGLTLSVL